MDIKDKETLQWIDNEFDPFSIADITYPKGKSDTEITVDNPN